MGVGCLAGGKGIKATQVEKGNRMRRPQKLAGEDRVITGSAAEETATTTTTTKEHVRK